MHSGEDGWLWVHVNLADARVGPYMRAHLTDLPKAAVDLLLSVGEHQQLHGDDACIYGVFADLVYRLEGLTDELGLLHFVATEKLDPQLILPIKEALLAIKDPEEVKRLLVPIKHSMTGLVEVENSDYDNLREIMKTVR